MFPNTEAQRVGALLSAILCSLALACAEVTPECELGRSQKCTSADAGCLGAQICGEKGWGACDCSIASPEGTEGSGKEAGVEGKCEGAKCHPPGDAAAQKDAGELSGEKDAAKPEGTLTCEEGEAYAQQLLSGYRDCASNSDCVVASDALSQALSRLGQRGGVAIHRSADQDELISDALMVGAPGNCQAPGSDVGVAAPCSDGQFPDTGAFCNGDQLCQLGLTCDCDDGDGIAALGQECDGLAQCEDGSDEIGCDAPRVGCERCCGDSCAFDFPGGCCTSSDSCGVIAGNRCIEPEQLDADCVNAGFGELGCCLPSGFCGQINPGTGACETGGSGTAVPPPGGVSGGQAPVTGVSCNGESVSLCGEEACDDIPGLATCCLNAGGCGVTQFGGACIPVSQLDSDCPGAAGCCTKDGYCGQPGVNGCELQTQPTTYTCDGEPAVFQCGGVACDERLKMLGPLCCAADECGVEQPGAGCQAVALDADCSQDFLLGCCFDGKLCGVLEGPTCVPRPEGFGRPLTCEGEYAASCGSDLCLPGPGGENACCVENGCGYEIFGCVPADSYDPDCRQGCCSDEGYCGGVDRYGVCRVPGSSGNTDCTGNAKPFSCGGVVCSDDHWNYSLCCTDGNECGIGVGLDCVQADLLDQNCPANAGPGCCLATGRCGVWDSSSDKCLAVSGGGASCTP